MRPSELNLITISGYTVNAHIALTQTVKRDPSTGKTEVVSSFILIFGKEINISPETYSSFYVLLLRILQSFRIKNSLKESFLNVSKDFKPSLRFSLI